MALTGATRGTIGLVALTEVLAREAIGGSASEPYRGLPARLERTHATLVPILHVGPAQVTPGASRRGGEGHASTQLRFRPCVHRWCREPLGRQPAHKPRLAPPTGARAGESMSRGLVESMVADASLAWLEEGYVVLHGPDTAVGSLSAERAGPDFRAVVLEGRLCQALVRLNPDLPPVVLRDTLLPRLISGELSAKRAHKDRTRPEVRC